jgi:NTE family protein
VLPSFGQRVGLVLSGGGAAGLAHIGVIRALEEHGIPIDYITGTSAGALVGSLYAAGYSAAEIEALVRSEKFQLMANGYIEPEFIFTMRAEEVSASMLNVPFRADSLRSKSLPTNLVTPALFDYEMLLALAPASASNGQNFDSLYVPFRCVAADIENKVPVIFRNGHLNQAVRASMTFPFYINPIRVNGVLMFDGGLYNNFPADVMYAEFDPDFIIGSNVSYNTPPPHDDDVLSHVRNMFMTKTNYELPCDMGVMIEPNSGVGTFQFDKIDEAIDAGYRAALFAMDSIKTHVKRSITAEERKLSRQSFHAKKIPFSISELRASMGKNKQSDFVRFSISRKLDKKPMNATKFKKQFFRLYGTPQIAYMYPLLTSNSDSTYRLDLDVKKSKEFKLSVGGHFSSRPVNTGYIGFSYYSLGKASFKANVESYFGKFYGSVKANIDFHVPSQFPFTIQPYFVMNRWDYFRSFATFFEPVKPSFLVQNEMYFGSRFMMPISTTTKTGIDFRVFYLEDRYYQTPNFSISDTADRTNFDGVSLRWFAEKNALNRKQFASSGHMVRTVVTYVTGREESQSGSTSPEKYDIIKEHAWINLQAEAQYFFFNTRVSHTGFHLTGVFNSQSLFKNYTASILSMTAFSPTPDSRTFFLEEYRSPQYVGLGINQIFTLKNKFDLRFDVYGYQPFIEIKRFDDGTFGYTQNVGLPRLLASSSLIYFSPIGPIRGTLNYFPQQSNPLSFQISFGYVIFNERAIR